MPGFYPFRVYSVKHSVPNHLNDYANYKPFLKDDYKSHCAYCNINDTWVSPESFHVDHFIPRVVFASANRNDLDTRYDNLVYSCPSCNRLKSSCFEGDRSLMLEDNKAFINPNKKDYNEFFYRDDLGRIKSDDDLGKKMIDRLCLFRSSKQLSWLLDNLVVIREKLITLIKNEENLERKQKLESIKNKVGDKCFEYEQLFKSLYSSRN